ncbi:MAG: GtrA family protein [Atopobiaceae bacterium]|uniref:GtrA family protein n=1 Tax=Olsenella absiana TaxID=3115222 RepID=A0ABU7R9A3_9ACTN|nr:GtrA family protein [Olsenella sp.]MDD7364343.1 GtrA family protein [Olsenella sp.]MDY3900102.1 GtrA family protein [Atopobiaceae bacterium]
MSIKSLIAQFLKFGVVGVLAAIIDFGVMILLHEVFGVDPVAAAAVSYVVSLMFNYWASMRYVFRHRDDLSRSREFVIFIVLSTIGFGINEVVMWGGTEALGDEWYVVVKFFATAIVALWNFFSRKKWLDASE